MDFHEVAPGLRYWLAPHPAWRPGNDWPEDVLCAYYEAPDALVLIDPLVPRGEEAEFWQALDQDVEQLGRPVRVLLTAPWHRRDTDVVMRRYGAQASDGRLPAGVEVFRAGPRAEEQVAYFIRPHRTLVVAEFFQGTSAGLRVAPSPSDPHPDELSNTLRALLDLPIERVLVAHGEPVLSEGVARMREALESA